MARSSRAIALAIAAFVCLMPFAANADANPYARTPQKGDSVRFSGAVGDEQFGWGFYNEYWLQTYLRFTIEAARNPSVYAKSQAALTAIGQHTLVLSNGTRAVVEEVKPYEYGGREDVQVRVMVQDGDLRGNEVWTTAGELVDSTGKTYLKS